MAVAALVAGYPGDDAWTRFARAWDARGETVDAVAHAILGDASERWMRTSVPALEGRTPLDVLEAEREGERAIRSLVMRLPFP